MKLQILLLAFLLVLPVTFGVTVSINFASPTHNFKGVGWNVNSTNFQNWTDYRIRPLLDSTHMQFARVLGWSPSWYAPSEMQRTYEATDMQGLYGFLQYAKENNITIQLANFDAGGNYLNSAVSGTNYWTCQTTALWPVTNCWPDQYFWLSEISHNDPTNLQNRFCHRSYTGDPGICSNADKTNRNLVKGPGSDQPYSADVFSRVLADSLDYLFNTKGFNNIQFISLWNEPNGDWAYHPRDASKKYPASFRELYTQMKAKLNSNPSLSGIKLVGFDGEFDQAEFQNIQNNIDAIGIHDYPGYGAITSAQQVISAKASTTKPIIIGEAGYTTQDSCGNESSGIAWENLSVERQKSKVLQSSIVSTNNIFSDIRQGAYAAARWWYNGDTGCMVATDGGGVTVNDIAKYNFNSVKILSESIPQANYDFKVLALSVSSGSKLNSVAIDYARAGDPQKIAIWIVNPDSQPITFSIPGTGLAGIKSLKKSLFDNSNGDIIYIPDQIPFSSAQPISGTIAPNSILVFTEYNAIPLTENCSNNIDDDGDGKIDCIDTDCANNSTPQPGGTCCFLGQKINSNAIAPGDTWNRFLCVDGQLYVHDGINANTISVPTSCTIKGNFYAFPNYPNASWQGGWKTGNGQSIQCGAKNCPANTCSGNSAITYPAACSLNCNNGTCPTTCTCTATTTACPTGQTCNQGTCTPNPACTTATQAVDCNDSNPCTNDTCTSGTCGHSNAANGTNCGTGKTCQNGNCIAAIQENCSTSSDDDGDGLINCADFTDCPNSSACGTGKKCDIQKQCIIVPTSACPDAKKDGTINILDLTRIVKAINENDLAFNIAGDSAVDIVDLRAAADKIGTNC